MSDNREIEIEGKKYNLDKLTDKEIIQLRDFVNKKGINLMKKINDRLETMS